MGEDIYNTFNSQRVHNYNIKELLYISKKKETIKKKKGGK